MTADRLVPLAILGFSVAALGLAYTAEHIFGVEPCILCLYQRLPFAIAGVLAVLALGMASGNRRAGVVAATGFVFLTGAGIAFYHVGVEQHWWVSAVGCGVLGTEPVTMAEMKRALLTKPPKACDIIDFSFFGISMATYNVVFSTALAAGALAGGWRLRD